ncbi:MAG: DUF4430 domain-containing protein [Candidatus Zixiibacteriota bacterium]
MPPLPLIHRHPTCLLALVLAVMLTGCGQNENRAGSPPEASADSVVIELAGRDSVSVFDLLRSSHELEFKSTAMGMFVRSIDSVANSSAAYWVYSVNDTMPKIASDKMLTRTGDRVRWHLRKTKQ